MTITLFLTCLNFLNAQNGYVKFNTDKEFKDKSIKIFKGEILPFTSADSKNIYLLFGKDSLKVTRTSKKFKQFTLSKDYRNTKSGYIITKPDGWINIDVNTLSDVKDTIKFITENQKVTPFFEKKEALLKSSDCGSTFRLIIPETPTIFYSANELAEYIAPHSTENNDQANNGDLNPSSNQEGISIWTYIFIGTGILLLFVLYKMGIIFPGKEPIREKFNSNSLDIFANEHQLGLKNLIKWNPEIDSNYNSLGNSERKRIKSNLKGKDLIIGFQKRAKSSDEGFNSSGPYSKIKGKENSNESEDQSENPIQPTGIGDDDLSVQLQKIELNILRAIRNIGAGGTGHSREMHLKNKINALETENKNLKDDKEKLDESINQLGIANSKYLSQLKEEMDKTQSLTKDLSRYTDKLIWVDFLKSYCVGVSSYFALCREVSNQAYGLFNRISKQNPEQAFAFERFLIEFQNSINTVPVGKWEQIVLDIKDTGTSNNKQLINSFKQPPTETEKQREFSRLLFTEVLMKYSGSILILAEAIRNLTRFQIFGDLANDAQNNFEKHVEDLLNRVQATGLTAKYVPLFRSYMDYLGQAKAVDEKLSIPYRYVKDLDKDSVAEVVSYGFKNTFGETDTLIILS